MYNYIYANSEMVKHVFLRCVVTEIWSNELGSLFQLRKFQNAIFVVKITKPFLLFRGSLHAFPFLGIFNVDKINGLHSLCLWIHHFLHLDRFLWPNHRDKIQRDQQNYWSLKQCIWHNFSMLAKSELVLTFWLSFYFQCPKNDNFGHLLSFKSVSQRVL